MDPKKVEFESTNIQFHSRNQEPTQSFERALKKALKKGSKEVRIYGRPQVIEDPKTGLICIVLHFSDEITKKIQDGTLIIKEDLPWFIDQETCEKMQNKEKRRLKNSTRVWRKE